MQGPPVRHSLDQLRLKTTAEAFADCQHIADTDAEAAFILGVICHNVRYVKTNLTRHHIATAFENIRSRFLPF